MSSDVIPEEIRQFIFRYIDSIAQLEALLLLRADPGRAWDAGEVAKRLYVGEREVVPLLERLQGDGFLLLDEEQRFRYRPTADELARLVDRLAEVYAKHLVPVTNLVHAKPRLRVQEFADAFKWRKEE
jgi:hypothetical protein